jgi:DNA-3-methyladenine glycosylase
VTGLEFPQNANLSEVLPAAFPASFYERSTAEVASALVGAWLVHGPTGGVVVETEAYLGPEDAASHARSGPTPRSGLMFGEPGRAYVYFVYGNHHCLNVVAHLRDQAGAVLIRAIEPRLGLEFMRARRGSCSERHLTRGPGRLCQALGIDGSFNGRPFRGADLLLGPAPVGQAAPVGRLRSGPRVGITRATRDPLRFFLEGNPNVSRGPCVPPTKP